MKVRTITNKDGKQIKVIFRPVPTMLWSPKACAEFNKKNEEELRRLKVLLDWR